MLTREEIINKAMDGIISQGRPSMNGIGCVYRNKGGLKCAAGHLIDDEHYDHSWNHLGVANPGPREALVKSGIGKEHLLLVAELQYIHDAYSPEDWPEQKRILLKEEVC
jgi:hypothetical protein